jgi:hypothetical protein
MENQESKIRKNKNKELAPCVSPVVQCLPPAVQLPPVTVPPVVQLNHDEHPYRPPYPVRS